MKKTTSEIGVLAPRLLPLADAEEREAMGLLADVLLDAARKRRGLRSDGVIGGACGSVIGSVSRLRKNPGNAREAA